MSIEFDCPGCQQRLAVPDENAGKQARCPGCQAIVQVPTSSPISPPQSAAAGESPRFGSEPVGQSQSATPHNPYAAPSEVSRYPVGPTGEMTHQLIDPIYSLTNAWELFKLNAGVLIAAYAIQVAASFGISIAGTFLQVGLGAALGDQESPLVLLFGFGTSIINQLVQLFLTIGLLLITFAIARNQPANLNLLFGGGRYLLRYIGASVLFGLGVLLGLLLLIVPGVYLILTYWSYAYFIIDRDCGVMESFRLAGSYGSGNRLNFFLLGCISAALGLLGLLMCIVGIFVTAPLTMLMFTNAYLMMTGQPFSQPKSAV